MHQREQLERAGRAAAGALARQGDWIHRRVEKISFPSPEEPIYRRHVSVDFTIPEKLIPVQPTAAPGRYYVPLSLVLKWPPLLRLDLRDALGNPVPFLTGEQNAVLDRSVLVALAENAVGAPLPNDIVRAIEAITKDSKAAEDALRTLLPSAIDARTLNQLDSARQDRKSVV